MTETQSYGDHRRQTPHVVFVTSAGMGHLTPFFRLAAQLSAHDCRVSLLTIHPTVSAAEARQVDAFFAAFPGVRPLHLHVPLLDPSELNSADPFFRRFESIRRSAHLLPPVLADASPPVSAAIIDISVASSYLHAVADMGIPAYVLFVSSATMLALCAYFPTYLATNTIGVCDIDIPGAGRVPKSSIPVQLHDPNQLFTKQFLENGQALPKAHGILVNTMHAWETEALAALNEGKVTPDMPPVLAMGPIPPAMSWEGESASAPLAWLDRQPERSVVYVSFGSRTAMPAEQIKELGVGLERSGWRFLWVVKSKVVDRAEVEVGLEELLGEEYLAKIKDRGMVVKDWVEQVAILRHRAVGGFVSHSGWNSVTEAALYGVRILAWPMGGDQRVNAAVVARSGLGIWVEGWSWQPEEEPVKGEEISERLRELMAGEGLRGSAATTGAAAADVGGPSYEAITHFIERLTL